MWGKDKWQKILASKPNNVGRKQTTDTEINLQWENEERKTQELLFLAQLIGEM